MEGAPRRALHAAENVLGEHLGSLDELPAEDLASLRNVIDAMVTKSRFKALAGGMS